MGCAESPTRRRRRPGKFLPREIPTIPPSPSRPNTFSLHGNLFFKLKRFAEAEAKYLAALAIEPGHERCLNNLINIYFVTGKIGQARGWLEKADQQKVKVNPGLEKAVRQAKPGEKSGNTP